jgi:hypothetical protein
MPAAPIAVEPDMSQKSTLASLRRSRSRPAASGAPQALQNRAPSKFSCPHLGHCTQQSVCPTHRDSYQPEMFLRRRVTAAAANARHAQCRGNGSCATTSSAVKARAPSALPDFFVMSADGTDVRPVTQSTNGDPHWARSRPASDAAPPTRWRTYWRTSTKSPANWRFCESLENRFGR